MVGVGPTLHLNQVQKVSVDRDLNCVPEMKLEYLQDRGACESNDVEGLGDEVC
jgi:hypothetical protein